MIERRLQHAMVVRTATDDRPSLHHHAMVVLVLDGRQPLPRAAPHGQNKHIVQASWLANTC